MSFSNTCRMCVTQNCAISCDESIGMHVLFKLRRCNEHNYLFLHFSIRAIVLRANRITSSKTAAVKTLPVDNGMPEQ